MNGYVGATAADLFGVSSRDQAALDMLDPGTSAHRTFASTEARNEPPRDPVRALLDPQGSAIFWIGLAALLGLVLVSGQVRVEAALGSRVGRK